MNDYGLVSIIMPLYNYGRFLNAAVGSVLSQTYTNWELIIVDDCSTDDSFEIAEELSKKDKRIRAYRLEKNGGTSAARNKGLDLAKGEFVAFLDSDDQYDPTYLESQLDLLVSNNADIAVASYRRKAAQSTTDFIVPDLINFKSILKGNPMAPLGTLYRFSKFKDLRFRLDMRKCEDYVFFLNLFQLGAVAVPKKKVLGTLKKQEDYKNNKKKKNIKKQ